MYNPIINERQSRQFLFFYNLIKKLWIFQKKELLALFTKVPSTYLKKVSGVAIAL
jgi:hypothetical protein